VTFSNPITGSQGTLVRPAIKSPDYVQGVSGWTINRDGSAEFNNLDVRGTFNGNAFVLNFDGLYFYYPTPGAGNLIASITNADGTDEYGNTVFQGIVNYSGNEYVQMSFGNFFAGVTGNPAAVTAGSLSIIGDNSAVTMISPTNTGGIDYASFWAAGGTDGPPGRVGNPYLRADNDLYILTAAMSAHIPSGGFRPVPYTWQTPTYASTWAAATTLNGSGNTNFNPLQYVFGIQDDVILEGACQSSGTSATITTLPSAYWPQKRALVPAWFNIGGTVHAGFVQVTEAGVVSAATTLSGVTIASGSQCYIKGGYPLGNRP